MQPGVRGSSTYPYIATIGNTHPFRQLRCISSGRCLKSQVHTLNKRAIIVIIIDSFCPDPGTDLIGNYISPCIKFYVVCSRGGTQRHINITLITRRAKA
ncbi:hypothetical protein [Chitinophaga sp. 212800010-3]|uniref:hypothetical protein n=1 Tax=unclassified Chitinophaga TaxID=2619133 RepID=UPI003FA44523